MKKEGEKEFEVYFTEKISHRVVVYAANEEVARYKVMDRDCLPLRKPEVKEDHIQLIVERQGNGVTELVWPRKEKE